MSAILEACVAFFETDQWPHQRVEDPPMVRSRYAGGNGTYDCFFLVLPAEQQLTFFAVAPVRAPAGRRLALAEFLTRVNFGRVVGNFELSMDTGEVRYKVSCDVEGIELVTIFLKNFSYAAVVTMNRFFPGIMKVLYSDIDPAEVLREIEGA